MTHNSRDQFLVPHVRPGVSSGVLNFHENGMMVHQMLIDRNISDENFRIYGLLHLESRLDVSAAGAWKTIKKLPSAAKNVVTNAAKYVKDKYDARQMRLDLVRRLKIAMGRIQFFIKNSSTYMKNREIFTKELAALTGILDELDQFTNNAKKVMLENFDDDKSTTPSVPTSASFQPPGQFEERQRAPYAYVPPPNPTAPLPPPFSSYATSPEPFEPGPPGYPPPIAPQASSGGARLKRTTSVAPPPKSVLKRTTTIPSSQNSVRPLKRASTFSGRA